jgi:hypothetical protein
MAQGNAQWWADLSVEPETITVRVPSSFSVDIWIRNTGRGTTEGVRSFHFDLSWDPGLTDFTGYTIQIPQSMGWTTTVSVKSGKLTMNGDAGEGSPYMLDDTMVLTVYFRCLGEGSSSFTFENASWIDGYNQPHEFTFHHGMCNQVAAPVGGYVASVGRWTNLAPYLTLIGLLAIVALIAVRKKRFS